MNAGSDRKPLEGRDKTLKEIQKECDEACREHVLWLLGRDEVKERRELEELVARIKTSHATGEKGNGFQTKS
jgi:hypothetical protein